MPAETDARGPAHGDAVRRYDRLRRALRARSRSAHYGRAPRLRRAADAAEALYLKALLSAPGPGRRHAG